MPTSRLKIGAVSALIAVAVTLAITWQSAQHHARVKLQEENQSLRLQFAQLQTDNEHLSNRVAQAGRAPFLTSERLRELLRLRGEVGLFRQQQRDLERALAAAKARTTGPAGQPGSALDATPQPSKPAPFAVQLVVDDPGENTESLTNNISGGTGETLHVQKTPLMDYTAISSANATTNGSTGTRQIGIEFSDVGKELFAAITRENVNKRLAIVLNGRLYAAPVIREEISDGRAQVTGSFTEDEARELAAKINEAITNE